MNCKLLNIQLFSLIVQMRFFALSNFQPLETTKLATFKFIYKLFLEQFRTVNKLAISIKQKILIGSLVNMPMLITYYWYIDLTVIHSDHGLYIFIDKYNLIMVWKPHLIGWTNSSISFNILAYITLRQASKTYKSTAESCYIWI